MNVRRPLAALAAAGLAVVALAGCSADQAGTASQVGATRITDRQVADYVTELQDQLGRIKGATFDEGKATSAAVATLTQHAMFEAIAAQEGISVSQGEVDSSIASFLKSNSFTRQQLLDNEATQGLTPASQIDGIVRDSLVSQALLTKIAPGVTDTTAQKKAFDDYITKFEKGTPIDVSPRFGTWDMYKLGPVPDDLSKPVVGASASASPSATPSPSAS